MENIFRFIDFHSTHFLVIGASSLFFIGLAFIALWVYNRQKFQNLKHQIPASVVHSYLDSIIQNSTALKSNLFRGLAGEAPVDIISPKVVPTSQLVGGEVKQGGVSVEELNQKNAHIATLKSQLADKTQVISDLEAKIEELLSQQQTQQQALASTTEVDSQQTAALTAQLSQVTQERDEYKARLDEYSIIEDDLAQLKRLQEENEHLKRSLQAGSAPMPVAEEETAIDEEPVAESDSVEEVATSAHDEDGAEEVIDEIVAAVEENEQQEQQQEQPVAMEAQTPDPLAEMDETQGHDGSEDELPENDNVIEMQSAREEQNNQQSAKAENPEQLEDLLSEFEKMLG